MNIYRVAFSHNNGDTYEYERHYAVYSPWYSTKELAEQQLPLLQKMADFLRHTNIENSDFYCSEPYIETKEVLETLGTIEADCPHYFDNFDEFEYIERNKGFDCKRTTLIAQTSCDITWGFAVVLDGELFDITFAEGKLEKCEKSSQEAESNFYRYSKEVRQEFLDYASNGLIEDVLPIYQKYYEKERSLSDEYYNNKLKSKKLKYELWSKWVSCRFKALTELFTKYEWLRISKYQYDRIKCELYSYTEKGHNEVAQTIVELLRLLERKSYDYGDRIVKY